MKLMFLVPCLGFYSIEFCAVIMVRRAINPFQILLLFQLFWFVIIIIVISIIFIIIFSIIIILAYCYYLFINYLLSVITYYCLLLILFITLLILLYFIYYLFIRRLCTAATALLRVGAHRRQEGRTSEREERRSRKGARDGGQNLFPQPGHLIRS